MKVRLGSFRSFLHDFDFFFGQAVEVIDETINLRVRGGDLAFERGLFVRRSCGQLLVQLQHLPTRDHPVVRGFVGFVGEVDDANRNLPRLNIVT